MRKWLAYIILLIMPLSLSAQEPGNPAEPDTMALKRGAPAGLPAMTQESMPEGSPDSIITEMRMRQQSMPAREPDTTFTKGSRQWTLSADYTTEIPVPLDTAFSLFHRYRITDKLSDFNAYTGNYGLPLYQINFFDREWRPDRFLYSYYMPFMHTPAKTIFVNTHVPFTEMKWSNAGARSKSEQTFRIRHSQNINRFLNFGFIYDIVYSIGQYNFQKAVDKNFLLHTSYNGNAYTSYFSAGINNHESGENGGIVSKDDLSSYTPENLPFVLSDLNSAQNHLKNRYILLVQRYTPGGKRDTVTGEILKTGPVTFTYTGSYEWNRRRYLDRYPLSALYDTVMIDRSVTADSLSQGLLSNTFRVDFSAGSTGQFRIGAGAGMRSEVRSFGQVVPGDTLTRPDTVTRSMSSLVLTGKVFNNIGTQIRVDSLRRPLVPGLQGRRFHRRRQNISRSFPVQGSGSITWDATGSVASYTPSFWFHSWGSNNFSWQLDHKRELRFTAGSSLTGPDLNLNLRFNYAIVDNFSYMGIDALPAQHEGGLSVALTDSA